MAYGSAVCCLAALRPSLLKSVFVRPNIVMCKISCQ